MLATNETIPLYLDGRQGYGLRLAGQRLLVTRDGKPAGDIALRRVGNIVFRQPAAPSVEAMLALVARGGTVHFQDGTGEIIAALADTAATPDRHVLELIHLMEGSDPTERYAEWLDLQLRHRISAIQGSGPRGGARRFELRLQRYAARGHDDEYFDAVWKELRGLCFAWIDAELGRQRMHGIVTVLRRYRLELVHDLDRIMAIPLLWQLAPWLRRHPRHSIRERTLFFEKQCHSLRFCLDLALSALHYHLRHGPRSRRAP